MRVEALPDNIVELIRTGQINENMDKKQLAKTLRDLGWDPDEAKSVVTIDNKGNMMLDATKGVQYLQESMDSILSGFRANTAGVSK